ncbi:MULTISPECIES: HAMP domain-containing protein [Streptomyces]|uniref:HAMP domain-containing protein n=1 Tax=Streptomyces dengpaensis TaxID=2049881 RepID=A0ABN5IDL7_9ACTN|nr:MULTISPECIES: HAMP domain-containing protein [Streptomyces]AVH61076.1 HAMP domain-containing protein [Streptomyces dengpaensis]PIB12343.1 HAMP domain-containing protein [Streptomyces sp. HG99]
MSLIGGIRPPIAVLSVLLLTLAGITALTLGKPAGVLVPKAVLTSQQYVAEDGAVALRTSLDESIRDLTNTATLFNEGQPVSADTVLDKIGNVYQKWRGTAVVEIKSGNLLAARGENVPLTAIDRSKLSAKDGLAPRMVRMDNGQTRLVILAVLSWEGKPQQLLVASSSLTFPGVSLADGRAIGVVDSTGQVLSSHGNLDTKRAQQQLKSFATAAAKKAEQHPITAKEPGAGGYTGVSGHLTGGAAQDMRTVGGYATLAAPVAGETTVASGLGLTVVTQVDVEERTAQLTRPAFGIAAAGALLVIGGLAVMVLLGTVQRPLIRLFLESRRLTRGDLARPVTVPKSGEAARVGAALERLRRQLQGAPADAEAPASRRGLGARALLAVCAVLLLAWSVPLMLVLNRADDSVRVPSQIVRDQKSRTATVSDRVRRALNEGHADLAAVAALIGDRTSAEDMKTVLERTVEDHDRYQSVYVLGADGTILAQAGSTPHHTAGKGPSTKSVEVTGEGGKTPVITATAEAPGRDGAAVVAEFRIEFLNALLGRQGMGDVRVLDAENRVIGGDAGYLAFQKAPSHLTPLLGKKDAYATVQRTGGTVRVAAVAPFTGGGEAKSLQWKVVSWQPASGLAIPEYSLQNRTVLAGLLGLTAAAACLGWLHIVVVRPLRELARQAEALAGGDRKTVLYPRHHDEVGAVARSLELIRQQLQEQRRGRDGGTRTPAGVGRN